MASTPPMSLESTRRSLTPSRTSSSACGPPGQAAQDEAGPVSNAARGSATGGANPSSTRSAARGPAVGAQAQTGSAAVGSDSRGLPMVLETRSKFSRRQSSRAATGASATRMLGLGSADDSARRSCDVEAYVSERHSGVRSGVPVRRQPMLPSMLEGMSCAL